MAIRREDFASIGGFDEEFFMYAEDMDLCEKIARAGLEVLQLPKARVIHLGGGTYTGSRTVLFNSLRSRDLLIVKNSGPLSLVVKRALILLGLLFTACRLQLDTADRLGEVTKNCSPTFGKC